MPSEVRAQVTFRPGALGLPAMTFSLISGVTKIRTAALLKGAGC